MNLWSVISNTNVFKNNLKGGLKFTLQLTLFRIFFGIVRVLYSVLLGIQGKFSFRIGIISKENNPFLFWIFVSFTFVIGIYLFLYPSITRGVNDDNL